MVVIRDLPFGQPPNLHDCTIFLFASSTLKTPSTFPPNKLNFPPSFGSKFCGGDRVNAATLCGSTKTEYSCSAEVWNSMPSVRVIVLTSGPELAVAFPCSVLEEPSAEAEEEEDGMAAGFGAAGPEPGACWMSLPCSAMRSPEKRERALRSWGTSCVRTRSRTACFSLLSE